jgi:hypothetical protein
LYPVNSFKKCAAASGAEAPLLSAFLVRAKALTHNS